ncbi:MAG: acyl-CoA dehydrogenase family protein, partial [Candidatus Dormiibacterota bacterium]
MDFGYDQDQEALRDLARKMLSDRATPRRLEEVEAGEERIDRDLWAEMAAAGLLGVCIPEEFGGSGLGLVELSVILEEVGRAVAPVPAWSTLALGALPVAEFGSTAQKESLLPGVVRGDVILSAALQEPGNYDPLSPVTTTATAAEGGWRLDGVKVAVPAAAQATAIIVPARVE